MKIIYIFFAFCVQGFNCSGQLKALSPREIPYISLLKGIPIEIDDSATFYAEALDYFKNHQSCYRLCDFVKNHDTTFRDTPVANQNFNSTSVYGHTDRRLIMLFFFDYYFFNTSNYQFYDNYHYIRLVKDNSIKYFSFGTCMVQSKDFDRLLNRVIRMARSKTIFNQILKKNMSILNYLGYRWEIRTVY